MKKDNTIEETTEFRPKFDQNGLIPCIAQNADDGSVLMLAYMNKSAIQLTLETGEAHYWSRSRQEIWHKGATSGNTQKVLSIQTDCDQDCILITVKMPKNTDGTVSACHTGRKSCFYRDIKIDNDVIKLEKD